jgi:hypothetical protein
MARWLIIAGLHVAPPGYSKEMLKKHLFAFNAEFYAAFALWKLRNHRFDTPSR